MKRRPTLTQAIVRELLDYDPRTGVLTWKPRALKWFHEDVGQQKAWNNKYAGTRAFTASAKTGYQRGYLRGGIFDKTRLAHRIIWLWMTGRWPEPEVDHINGVRSDNRWINLAESSRMENAARGHKIPRTAAHNLAQSRAQTYVWQRRRAHSNLAQHYASLDWSWY